MTALEDTLGHAEDVHGLLHVLQPALAHGAKAMAARLDDLRHKVPAHAKPRILDPSRHVQMSLDFPAVYTLT